jgi:type VI secretion system ImpB/VipA family protein
MPKALTFEKPEMNLVASMEESKSLPESDMPFRIALLGDWSGQATRKLSTNESQLTELRPVLIDRDNFDDVMRKLGVEVRLDFDGAGSSPITLQFNELDDFLPDRIFERLELFDALKQTRQRLNNPATFADAADEVRGWAKIKPDDNPRESTQQESVSASAPSPTLGGSDLLDQILGEAEGQAQPIRHSATSDDLQSQADAPEAQQSGNICRRR